MADLFIKSIKLIHPESPYHLKDCDVQIKGGRLVSIVRTSANNSGSEHKKTIDGRACFLAPSFVDCSFWQGEPGNERIEDLSSSARLAIASGYGHLMLMSDTENACIESDSDVQFYQSRSADYGINFLPVARVTRQDNPANFLTEIMHLSQQGVGAFSNGRQEVSDLNLFSRVLEYSSMTAQLFMNQPLIKELAGSASVHASAIAEQMGLNGLLPQAEYAALSNQIELAKYYQIPFFAMNVSSKTSVKILKDYKKKNESAVFASVPILNLYYTNRDQMDFDTNKKLWPVLREESDRKALIRGLKEGTIDLVGSNHFPVAEEEKKVEFNYAPFGAITLQLVYPLLLDVLGGSSAITELVEILSLRPREIFSIPQVRFEEGERADYCILNEKEWEFNKASNVSKSSNTSFLNERLTGQCVGLIRDKKYWLNEGLG